MRVVAEWNLTQEDLEAAHANARRGRRGAPPKGPRALPPRGRSQSPRNAMAMLAKAGNEVNVAPDAASFWFGSGLVTVSP